MTNPVPGGGNSASLTFQVKPPLSIEITSPSNGGTLTGSTTVVSGTFVANEQDIGIQVNGIPASISGNEWVADDVPLTLGTNIINATITDQSGNSATTSITVNVDSVNKPVTLSANIDSGVPPFTSYFQVETDIPNPVVKYQMDFYGDGVADYTGTDFENITYLYNAPGIYNPKVTITDSKGNTYSDSITITVYSKTQLDALLQSKWNSMKSALINGDVNTALGYFEISKQGLYKDIFTELGTKLPQIIQNMQAIQFIYSEGNMAKYAIPKTELYGGQNLTVTYWIYFVKDQNGIWKIYRGL